LFRPHQIKRHVKRMKQMKQIMKHIMKHISGSPNKRQEKNAAKTHFSKLACNLLI
jgi:hypothetical protein